MTSTSPVATARLRAEVGPEVLAAEEQAGQQPFDASAYKR
jgi:hypothetical protein